MQMRKLEKIRVTSAFKINKMNKYTVLLLYSLPGLLLAIVSAVFGWALFPSIIHSQIEQEIRLVEGTNTWKGWKEAPIPVYLDIYLFHVTNPDEVENGLKPVFQEKGPYAYLQKRVKVDIRQDDGKNTVKYREVKTYFFDQKKSGNNREDDLVNIPNIPFIGIIHGIKKMLPIDLIVGLVGNIVLNGEPLIRRNVTVRELLFEGFDVTKYTNSLLGRQLPKEFSGGRFGLYKGKNGTAGEEWEVYTGVENSEDFGRIKTLDGRDQLGFWRKFSPCDKLTGTDGSLFHPFITKDALLEVFSTDVCRSLTLVYKNDMEHLGIPGYRFAAADWAFEDPRIYPANRCYCMEDKLEDCPYAGLVALESCTQAPLWTSRPHFLDSDIRYLVESGLEAPDREKHDTFIDIEPTTGLTLRAHKRLQLGLEVRYNRRVRAYQRLTKEKLLFPVLWADENAELDENFANQLKSQLFTPLKVVSIAKWVLLVTGLVLIAVGIYFYMQKYVLHQTQKKVGLDLTRQSSPVSTVTASIDGNSANIKKKSMEIKKTIAREARSTSASGSSIIT